MSSDHMRMVGLSRLYIRKLKKNTMRTKNGMVTRRNFAVDEAAGSNIPTGSDLLPYCINSDGIIAIVKSLEQISSKAMGEKEGRDDQRGEQR
jgi:hypothetical protein